MCAVCVCVCVGVCVCRCVCVCVAVWIRGRNSGLIEHISEPEHHQSVILTTLGLL